MARRNFPDVTPEVVQHGSGWAIWLAMILRCSGRVCSYGADRQLPYSGLIFCNVRATSERIRPLIELARYRIYAASDAFRTLAAV